MLILYLSIIEHSYMVKRMDVPVGTRFGMLVIIDQNYGYRGITQKKRVVLCQCDCGQQKPILLPSLRSGKTYSCGCYISPKEMVRRANSKSWARSRRKRHPRITTAIYVWKNNYDDGCSFEKFLELSQKECFYCKQPPSNKANAYKHDKNMSKDWIDEGWFIYNGLDRIDATKQHTEDNIVPSCKRCNWAKSDMTQGEFYELIRKIYKNKYEP